MSSYTLVIWEKIYKILCHLNHSALPPKQNDLDDNLSCSVFFVNCKRIYFVVKYRQEERLKQQKIEIMLFIMLPFLFILKM